MFVESALLECPISFESGLFWLILVHEHIVLLFPANTARVSFAAVFASVVVLDSAAGYDAVFLAFYSHFFSQFALL